MPHVHRQDFQLPFILFAISYFPILPFMFLALRTLMLWTSFISVHVIANTFHHGLARVQYHGTIESQSFLYILYLGFTTGVLGRINFLGGGCVAEFADNAPLFYDY